MMKMMHGRAFSIGEAGQSQSPMDGTPTFKRWFQLGGHNFLMEEVPYPRVAAQLQKLPPSTGRLTTASTNLFAANSFLDAIPGRLLSPSPPSQPVKTQTMRLSRADGDQTRAVVLDYVLMNGDTNNFTLQGDTTYLISGWVNLNGATTIEGGTVVKYDDAVNSILCFWGTVACKTGSYRPAIFTSRNDTSVGEDVNDGGSLELYQAIAGTAVGNSAWHNLIVRYAQTGVHYYSINLTDCQFVNCQDALYTEWGPANLTNVLFVNVNTPFAGTTYNATGYHITIDGCTNGQVSSDWAGRGLSTVQFVNSLLVNAGADGDAAITTNYTVRLVTNPASIFQAVRGGSCYLKTNSPYHQQGTTNITPAILADIAAKTTYPPIVYSNITISAATTFSPQARQDTNSSPDLGYHYDPLDYVFGGVNAYSNLTFTAGTAMGYFELPGSGGPGYGISIFDNVILALNGTASLPCTVARYSTVQEGGTGLWRDKGWLAAIVGQSLSGGYYMNPANAAQVWPNFTRHATLAGDPGHYREYNALLKIAAQNSELWGSWAGGYWEYLNFTNCLFDRTRLGMIGGNPAICGLRNCTFHAGDLTLYKYGQTWPVWIEECAFDGTTFSVDDNSGGNTNITYCDFNAFLTNGQRLPMRGAHDVTNLLSFNWQSSWLGNYYLPANSPLIDHGSTTADQVGLYWFTTQTNQVAEGFSIVDIGYHYVAVDANGNPLQTLTNNAPDYLVDANGNGLPDWWEMFWFGTLAQSGANLDGNGKTFLYDYQHNLNPSTISFTVQFTNLNLNVTNTTGSYVILGGAPYYEAVLVNDTNFNHAVWTNYNGIMHVNLGPTDGVYQVSFGLQGFNANAQPSWMGTDLTLTRTNPHIVITNPTTNVVAQPYLQLQGYSALPLAGVTFDLSNAVSIVTNQPGFIIGHTLDTNTMSYTMDYFQCYDIRLTNGLNTISVHCADPAGNVVTTNLLVTLNYSNASAPVIKLTWPTNGMEICGNSFTLRGWTEDASATVQAQITDTNHDTNVVSGFVERTGVFWLNNLPLAEGTNMVTLWVTNSAKLSSTMNILVVKSDMTLTLDGVDGDLWLPTVHVTGSISDTTAAIWVNGVQGTNYGNGSWEAYNVPVTLGGVASFDMNAIPAGSGDPGANDNRNKSDEVMLDSDKFGDSRFSQDGSYTIDEGYYTATNGGKYYSLTVYSDNSSDLDMVFFAPGGVIADEVVSNSYGITDYPNGIGGPTGPGSFEFPIEHGTMTGGPDGQLLSQSRHADAKLMFHRGGPLKPGQQALLSVNAWGGAGWEQWGRSGVLGWAIPYNQIKIPAVPGNLGTDGWGYGLMQGNTVDMTSIVNVPMSYFFMPIVSVGVPTVIANGVWLDPDEVAPGANFCVGQNVNFNLNWNGSLAGGAIPTNFQWRLGGTYVNRRIPAANGNSSDIYTNDPSLLKNVALPTNWWVSGGLNPPVTYTASVQCDLIFTNGNQKQPVNASGQFTMIQPLPNFSANILEPVAVDTNYYENGELAGGTWLHFGIASNLANMGIVFISTNVPYQPPLFGVSNVLYGEYFVVQIINDSHAKENFLDGIHSRQRDNYGLDKNYPYQNHYQANSFDGIWYDAPADRLDDYSWASRSESFTDYLMFLYPGGIAVPMYQLTWGWSGEAKTNGASGGYTLLSDPHSPACSGASLTTDFPQWSTNASYFRWQTNNTQF